jgi:glycosyltransferase involved in cell wall biosynthesis
MKYSIITPTYNRPDLLKRAFDSVINQEIKNEFASEKNKENEKKIE